MSQRRRRILRPGDMEPEDPSRTDSGGSSRARVESPIEVPEGIGSTRRAIEEGEGLDANEVDLEISAEVIAAHGDEGIVPDLDVLGESGTVHRLSPDDTKTTSLDHALGRLEPAGLPPGSKRERQTSPKRTRERQTGRTRPSTRVAQRGSGSSHMPSRAGQGQGSRPPEPPQQASGTPRSSPPPPEPSQRIAGIAENREEEEEAPPTMKPKRTFWDALRGRR